MPSAVIADEGASFGTELIAEKLFWTSRWGAKDIKSVSASDLCCHGSQQGEAGSKYVVRHYSQAAVGKAFGPLGFDSILRFCCNLDAELRCARKVAIRSPARKEERANSAVLVGAYLLLRQRWTCKRVLATLGSELGNLPFLCSWARGELAPPVMNVHDCWLGLELAVTQGWFKAACLDEGEKEKVDVAVSNWLRLLLTYDSTWLVPGAVMVAADPTTTCYDPSPSTCKSLFPAGHEKNEINTCDEPSRSTSKAPSEVSFDSVITVCKEYADSSAVPGQPQDDPLATDLDFVTFLQRCGVGLVVRANFDREPGMPHRGASYGDTAFEAFGIAQTNIRVLDQDGGVPRPRDILRCLDECAKTTPEDGGAVLIHCKGGFGRSVVLACCLAIDRLDVPGRALLGWARIVRPGSVTTASQERFLKRLRGREDLRNFVRNAGGRAACTPGCEVQ